MSPHAETIDRLSRHFALWQDSEIARILKKRLGVETLDLETLRGRLAAQSGYNRPTTFYLDGRPFARVRMNEVDLVASDHRCVTVTATVEEL